MILARELRLNERLQAHKTGPGATFWVPGEAFALHLGIGKESVSAPSGHARVRGGIQATTGVLWLSNLRAYRLLPYSRLQ
jgi:hypothetical protein